MGTSCDDGKADRRSGSRGRTSGRSGGSTDTAGVLRGTGAAQMDGAADKACRRAGDSGDRRTYDDIGRGGRADRDINDGGRPRCVDTGQDQTRRSADRQWMDRHGRHCPSDPSQPGVVGTALYRCVPAACGRHDYPTFSGNGGCSRGTAWCDSHA